MIRTMLGLPASRVAHQNNTKVGVNLMDPNHRVNPLASKN
jgi:hypothetical protein